MLEHLVVRQAGHNGQDMFNTSLSQEKGKIVVFSDNIQVVLNTQKKLVLV